MSRFDGDRLRWKRRSQRTERIATALPFFSDNDEPSTLDSNRQLEDSAPTGQNQGQDDVPAEKHSTVSCNLPLGTDEAAPLSPERGLLSSHSNLPNQNESFLGESHV